MRPSLIFLVLFLLFTWRSASADPVSSVATASSAAIDSALLDNSSYGLVLSRFVDDEGRVNYRELKGDPSDLDKFVADLAKVAWTSLDNLPDDQQLVFWINAYNALVLKVIIINYPIKPSFPVSDNYPESSIRQIRGVWDKLTFSVGGRKVTLNDIQHKVLRARFREPRMHMALSAAAVGSGILRKEPYEAKKLEAQLNDQAKRFLRRAENIRLLEDGETLELSAIFSWFAKDFLPEVEVGENVERRVIEEKAALAFLKMYAPPEIIEKLKTKQLKISYSGFDWNLNNRL